MTQVLRIGNRTISTAEIIHLLAEYQMLPQLCRSIIIEQAIAATELNTKEEEIAIEQFFQKNQLATPELRATALKHYGMTLEQLEAAATRELRIEKFKIATWGSKLESYFLTCKSQLDQVIYSLIRTSSMEVAQELYFRIKAGEQSFALCAKEYSTGAEAQTGGLLGPVPMSQLHPAIAQKLAISQPGQLWPPMPLDDWVVIVRLEQMMSVQLDDAMSATLLNHLFEQWLAEQLQLLPISLIHNDNSPDLSASIPALVTQ